jgi:PAS domain S-box-containing protein
MKTKLIAVVVLAGTAPLLASLAANAWFGQAPRIHPALHEALELAGSGIALGVALLLRLRLRRENASPHLLWVSAGLVAMGLVDGAHSLLPFGVAFSWTRHGATLAGGVIFSLVWLPLPASVVRGKQPFILLAAVLALAGVLAIWHWPERLPAPWVQGNYSRLVIATNAAGGLGFLSAAWFFFRRYQREPQTEDLVFASHALLFASASLFFGFSHVWAPDWWVWHAARLLAYAVLLVLAYELVSTLYQHLFQYTLELESRIQERTSELAAANAALRETNDYLENLFHYAQAPIVVWDTHLRITRFNHAFESLTGRTARSVVGCPLGILFPPSLAESSLKLIQKPLDGEKRETVEIAVPHLAGPVRTLLWSSATLFAADGKTPVATIAQGLDITERKQAEAALNASEERFRRTMLDSPFPILLHAEDGRILQASNSWCEITGYSREELATIADWTERAYGERKTLVQADIDRLYGLDHRIAEGDYSIRTKSGETRIWEFSSAPLGREPGGRRLVISMAMDVTERRLAEREVLRLNAELEQRVKDRTFQLEAANRELEAFSYSVSHDLRAPLRAINGYARVLTEDHGPTLGAEGQRVLGVIRSEALRMGRLIDDLLQFSRLGRQPLRVELCDLAALAREVFAELRGRLPDRVVDFQLARLPDAPADQVLLRQVWFNLFDNALKFTRHRERATIEASGVAQCGEAVYCVRDNGAGFDMKYAGKLFGVFQRLHGADDFEGTGVGLALVQRLVQRHGGRVWAEAGLDRGAAFYFTLPLAPGQIGATGIGPASAHPETGSSALIDPLPKVDQP